MDQGPYQYDLVVIGNGPGGLAAAKEAAAFEKKVLVLDWQNCTPTAGSGAGCANVGCVPRKLMYQAAQLGRVLKDSRRFGWECEERVSHSWSRMAEAVQNHIKSFNLCHYQDLLDSRVTYLSAFGELVGPHTIKVMDAYGNETYYSAAVFIISTRGKPRYLGVPGDREYCVTSDDLLSLPRCPGRTLVVGASVAGLECAGFLSGLGLEVTVMVRSVLLRGWDRKMAQKIENHMFVHGVNFLHNFVPVKIEQVQEGQPGRLRVTAQSTHGTDTYQGEFDTVLLAIGRDACIEDIAVDRAGSNTATGKIPVNEYEQTNVGHIFAVGGVQEGRSELELTPVAIQAGRLLARRLYRDRAQSATTRTFPSQSSPPLSTQPAGLSEESANHTYGGDNIEVYHSCFWPLEWTLPARDKNSCYVKVICHIPDHERVVGLHVLGPNAGEIIQGFAVALRCGLTKEQLDTTAGVHPGCAEVLTTLTVTQRVTEAMIVRGNC